MMNKLYGMILSRKKNWIFISIIPMKRGGRMESVEVVGEGEDYGSLEEG